MAAPTKGVSQQPSWGRLGLEVLTDLIGWFAVFAIVQGIGIHAFQKVAGPSLLWDLLLVLILFVIVTVVVRIAFIAFARRTAH
jgi:hypothetical protein